MGSAVLASSTAPPQPFPWEIAALSSKSGPRPPHSRILAEIIESFLDVGETRPLSRGLEQGRSVSVVLDELPLDQRSLLSQRFGRTGAAELATLAGERDPEFFLEGLVHLARRNFTAGRAEAVGDLVAALRNFLAAPEFGDSLSPSLRSRVEGEVSALQGRGSVGRRVEHHLQNFAREATHPAMLAGFGFGAAAFQGARLLALTRLSGASAGFLTRGGGARFLAGTAGWAAEVPALTLGSRGVRAALGERVPWNAPALGHELGATALTLGLMRLSAFGARRGFETVHGLPASGASLRGASTAPVSGPAFQQGAMLGSLMLAHEIEARLGLRPASDLAGNFTESLALLLQFHVGGRLFHALQPGGFARALRIAETQSRGLPGPLLRPPSFHIPRVPVPAGPSAALGSPTGPVWMAELPKRGPASRLEARPGDPRARSSAAPLPFNFRDLVEEAPDPVIVTEAGGRPIYFNRVGRELVEGTPFGWMQGRLEEFFLPVEGEPGVFHFSREGQETRYWKIRSQTLEFGEGLQVHHLKDITAARRLEEAKVVLELQMILAEGLVHDAGNMIADAYFQEQSIEKALDGSSSPVSSPFRHSTRFPKAASSAESPASVRSILTSIVDRVRDLGGTLNTTMQVFRDNQRVLAGSGRVRILPVQMLLEKALRLNETMRDRSHVRLTTDFGEEPPIMMGEEGPLLSAVLNLLINACHAMPRGGQLAVRTFARDGMVTIEVRDTGVGIAPENLAHIFEPHFTTKEHSGGTGMGLANVKIAVERIHRGRIEVDSEVGQGTTFRLILPQMRPRSW